MSVLSDDLEIRPYQKITVFYGGTLGLFKGPESLKSEIKRVFEGTSFVIDQQDVPTFSEVSPPSFVGHFIDQGGGYSLPSRNIKVAEAKRFFLDRLSQVEGLYLERILSVHLGVTESAGPFGLGTFDLRMGLVVAGIIGAVLLIAQLRSLVGK